ncbi:MAG: hypothetical protein JW757_10785 [Anaerolineales bacterium]|nr:hypothetical protein [Anaerolineales bacterium]
MTTLKRNKARKIARILASTFFALLIGLEILPGWLWSNTAFADAPEPTPDRLAEPVLTEHSTQYEEGRYLYWMHCMPCHGDFGQGLTDEFRELWPEDHQNCWGRGCHGGREMDEGFPIPKTIPAVISESGEVLPFSTPEEFYEYLLTTHPPQNPGYLAEDEYWAMTAYVLAENNLIQVGKEIGPNAGILTGGKILAVCAIGVLLLLVFVVVGYVRRNRQDENSDSHEDGEKTLLID